MSKIYEHEKYIALYEKYDLFLTQTQKQALHLSLIEDLSLSEIADILATTRSAVHDAITKAKRKLDEIEVKMQN